MASKRRRYEDGQRVVKRVKRYGGGGVRAWYIYIQSSFYASTTSFEFLISKPPCNYWINVNYDDALCSVAWQRGEGMG